jgi:hypothetical protein
MPSDATRDLALQNGELDMGWAHDRPVGAKDASVKGLKVLSVSRPAQRCISTSRPSRSTTCVRVIAHAIDRKAMVALLGTGVTRGDQRHPRQQPGTAKLTLPGMTSPRPRSCWPGRLLDGLTIKVIISTIPLSRSWRACGAQRLAGIALDVRLNDRHLAPAVRRICRRW